MELVLEYQQSKLIAVPAVHNRVAFAQWVNTLGKESIIRPDAIAVELEPDLLEELIQWLGELSNDSRCKIGMLPCMLGLFRVGGSESGAELACLSVTDSIIEAVRCGLEMGIPVFALDIPDSRLEQPLDIIIEDPSNAQSSLAEYVAGNEEAAHRCRDQVADSKREIVMAGRLKWVMQNYSNVLYTGGLAHWKQLRELLADETVPALECIREIEAGRFKRVLVHPLLAISFMDIFPKVSYEYEYNRESERSFQVSDYLKLDLAELSNDILASAYEEFRIEINSDKVAGRNSSQYTIVPAFETLLRKLCLLSRETVPGMWTTLSCAKTMMPKRFVEILTNKFMHMLPDWASPALFPELPVLVPSITSDKLTELPVDGVMADLLEPFPGETIFSNDIYKRTGTYFIPIPSAAGRQLQGLNLYWDWKNKPSQPNKYATYNSWAWPPCEALLYGTAFQAARIARDMETEKRHANFEGSMHEGLDVKATLRSLMRGEKLIQVKTQKYSRISTLPDGKSPDPTVFIFNTDKETKDSSWEILIAGSTVKNHVRDKEAFKKFADLHGDEFIASISRASYSRLGRKDAFLPERLEILDGVTLYGNPCLNSIAGAQWIEDNNYKCSPALPYTSFTMLVKHFLQNYNIDLSKLDWQSVLLISAIPYAKERVVIVAPQDFKLESWILAFARSRKIVVTIVPLSYFPDERILEMRKRFYVRSIDRDGCRFPPETEHALGQKQDCYMEMLPKYIQRQGSGTNMV